MDRTDCEETGKKEIEAFNEFIAQLGWDPDTVSEDMLNALVRRGLRLKEATENAQTIDWSTVKYRILLLVRLRPQVCNRDALSKQRGAGRESEDSKDKIDLDSTVRLLSKMQACDLKKLLEMEGDKKQAMLYRSRSTLSQVSNSEQGVAGRSGVSDFCNSLRTTSTNASRRNKNTGNPVYQRRKCLANLKSKASSIVLSTTAAKGHLYLSCILPVS